MPERTKSNAARALLASLGLGVAVLVLASGRLTCTSAALFGISCPMCGSTRAMQALVHGDLPAVLRFNPVAPFVVAILAALGARLVFLQATKGNAKTLGEGPTGRGLVYAFLAALIVETLVWLLRFGGAFGGPVVVARGLFAR